MSYEYEQVEITLKREDGSFYRGVLNKGGRHTCYINFAKWDEGPEEVTIDGSFTVVKTEKLYTKEDMIAARQAGIDEMQSRIDYPDRTGS